MQIRIDQAEVVGEVILNRSNTPLSLGTKPPPEIGLPKTGVPGNAELVASIDRPEDTLPDILYVNEGIWRLARDMVERMLENPVNATVTNLGKLVSHAQALDDLILSKLEQMRGGAGKSKLAVSGGSIEITERKVRMQLTDLIELTGADKLGKFHKDLAQKADVGTGF